MYDCTCMYKCTLCSNVVPVCSRGTRGTCMYAVCSMCGGTHNMYHVCMCVIFIIYMTYMYLPPSNNKYILLSRCP